MRLVNLSATTTSVVFVCLSLYTTCHTQLAPSCENFYIGGDNALSRAPSSNYNVFLFSSVV